jgi:hypothetical protein
VVIDTLSRLVRNLLRLPTDAGTARGRRASMAAAVRAAVWPGSRADRIGHEVQEGRFATTGPDHRTRVQCLQEIVWTNDSQRSDPIPFHRKGSLAVMRTSMSLARLAEVLAS